MPASRHQLLDDALAMSRQMVELGDVGDWEAVIALEPARRELLEQAFATHAPADEFITERVRAILDLDRSLMQRTVQARDAIAAELGRNREGRKAAAAYQSARRRGSRA